MINDAWGSGSLMCQHTSIHTPGLYGTLSFHERWFRRRYYLGGRGGGATRTPTAEEAQSPSVIHPFWRSIASRRCPLPVHHCLGAHLAPICTLVALDFQTPEKRHFGCLAVPCVLVCHPRFGVRGSPSTLTSGFAAGHFLRTMTRVGVPADSNIYIDCSPT